MPYTGTQALLTAGTTLWIGTTASPPVFKKIGEVIGIPTLSNERQLVEVTNLESTTKEFIAGLADGAQVDLNMNLIEGDDGQDEALDAYGDGLERDFKVIWSYGFYQTFRGLVLSFGPSAEVNSAFRRTLKLKLNGDLSAEVVNP